MKESITISHARCLIVGCGGAGKTTLLKRLQNADLKELMNIKSTEIVDIHVNSFEVIEKENTIKSKNILNSISRIHEMEDILVKH